MLPFTLTTYGFPHRMGYLAAQNGAFSASPMTVPQVLEAARDFGLAGVDMPLPSETVLSDDELRDALNRNNLRLVAEYMSLVDTPPEAFAAYLRRAAFLGVRVVRVLISTVLCGDRRTLTEGWDERMELMAQRLRLALPRAADLGISIAVENHQDATADDLFHLYERTGQHPAFGVTLDTGNPLAVGEEPVESARRLLPLLRHLHLKDYTIHFAPEGYRLVRCAAGTGVVNFPAILELVKASPFPDLLPGIEIAAQPTRTIPILDEGWWAHYPITPVTETLGALRILWEKGRPREEPYSSVWEQGGDSAAVGADEWETVTRSVAYFRSLSTISPMSAHG